MNFMAWAFLLLAIAFEVAGTLSLRMLAVHGKRWLVPIIADYAVAFTSLSMSLSHGMPLGVAYGTWVAVGVALVAILGRLLFKDPFTKRMAAGVVLVMAGVLLIEIGATY